MKLVPSNAQFTLQRFSHADVHPGRSRRSNPEVNRTLSTLSPISAAGVRDIVPLIRHLDEMLSMQQFLSCLFKKSPSDHDMKIASLRTIRGIFALVIAWSTALSINSRSWADAAIDENKAVELVFKSPKVRIFLREMKIMKQRVGAMTERTSKCVFNVRVFEDHADHIATFGFYDADICRSAVKESQ